MVKDSNGSINTIQTKGQRCSKKKKQKPTGDESNNNLIESRLNTLPPEEDEMSTASNMKYLDNQDKKIAAKTTLSTIQNSPDKTKSNTGTTDKTH